MKAQVAVNETGARRGVLILTMALLAVLLLGPSGASAKKTLAECTDDTWVGYNNCLMGRKSEWGRVMCDISWQLEVAECYAQEIGEVRKAYEGRNEPD